MALIDTAQLDGLTSIIGKETYQTIYQSYLADATPKLAQLQTVVEAEDSKQTESISHSLKSASANLAMSDLAARFSELEQQGKTGDAAGAKASIEGIDDLYQTSTQALADYLAN